MTADYGPSKLLGLFKQSMVLSKLVSDPARGLYGLTEREMELQRMEHDFIDALERTEWWQREFCGRRQLRARQFRVIVFQYSEDPLLAGTYWVHECGAPSSLRVALQTRDLWWEMWRNWDPDENGYCIQGRVFIAEVKQEISR